MATSTLPKKTVLVPIADGSEEVEFTSIVDILRRGEVEVTVASVMPQRLVKCSRGVKIEADVLIDEIKGNSFDAIILPGGMPGAKNLADSQSLTEILSAHTAQQKLFGGVCAAPVVALQANGFIITQKATAFPAHSDKLANQTSVESSVVIDGNLITSRALGTSLKFALAILELLRGKEVAEDVRKRALIPEY